MTTPAKRPPPDRDQGRKSLQGGGKSPVLQISVSPAQRDTLIKAPPSSDQRLIGWNPRDDDGDSRRLQVKLKIPTQFPDWADVARAWGPKHGDPCDESLGVDPCAATRLAVLRAAAEVGRAMP